jgi:predicted nucleotidyltransferase
MIEASNKYLEIAKEIILSLVDKEKVSVFLYGSRAGNYARHDSDIDVGLWSSSGVDSTMIRKINDAIEESIVPYHIDITDFTKVSSKFKKIAAENIIIWNKGIDFDLNLKH